MDNEALLRRIKELEEQLSNAAKENKTIAEELSNTLKEKELVSKELSNTLKEKEFVSKELSNMNICNLESTLIAGFRAPKNLMVFASFRAPLSF